MDNSNVIPLRANHADPNRAVRHALYGCVIAVTSAMSDEKAAWVNSILAAFAEDPNTPPDEAAIYLSLVERQEAERGSSLPELELAR